MQSSTVSIVCNRPRIREIRVDQHDNMSRGSQAHSEAPARELRLLRPDSELPMISNEDKLDSAVKTLVLL